MSLPTILSPLRSSSKGATVVWSALSGGMIRAIRQTRNNHSFRDALASMPRVLGCFSWSTAFLIRAARSTCHSHPDHLAFQSP